MTELAVQKAIRIRKVPHNKKRSGRMSAAAKIRRERKRLDAKQNKICFERKLLWDKCYPHPNKKKILDHVADQTRIDCPDCGYGGIDEGIEGYF